MRHGSLFSGIGGFDLAAEWMGWENVFHCEWNQFGQRVLKHYWPNAKSYHDITQTDFTIHRGAIDILTGGFPCQPYSAAGKRLGKEDERHLWPEMLRAIREIAPKYIVGENVLGLVNWNGGLVFDEVQADLESAGYEVATVVIPAAAVNAPHGRDRVWFVAANTKYLRCVQCQQQGQSRCGQGVFKGICHYGLTADTDNTGDTTLRCGIERNRTQKSEEREYAQPKFDGYCINGLTEDTLRDGRIQRESIEEGAEVREQRNTCTGDTERICGTEMAGFAADTRLQRQTFRQKQTTRIKQCSSWTKFPTQSPICGGDDGLPRELDGITFSKWRNESIRAYGNAIVPNVAFEIFKVIQIIANT